MLFLRPDDGPTGTGPREPSCFRDLNLDQIVAAVSNPRQEYQLAPYFYLPLSDVDSVTYRHEVFSDLERDGIRAAIDAFAADMRTLRKHFAEIQKLYYPRQKHAWLLDAVIVYCGAVETLAAALEDGQPRSRGLAGIRDYAARYARGERFRKLHAEARRLTQELAGIRYELLIKTGSVEVRKYEGGPDYSLDVSATFAKFRQGETAEYAKQFPAFADMNHVEAGILDRVALLFPDVFDALARFAAANADFADPGITRFDREIQFYAAWLDHMERFTRAGLRFCFPQVSRSDKTLRSHGGFDLALADKLLGENRTVVTNDFFLEGQERIIVVSGPNQGGKTTFARTFGQLHYLASLGCPVPGSDARLFLFDRLFTHFEREEDISTFRGKLEDDLVRIHDILESATPDSIIVMNEIFTSTTPDDAVMLGEAVMARIVELDLLCVCVTFLDELAAYGPTTVSMVSTVVPENPAQRTFKIVRRPADGRAYAISIAESYGLTHDRIKERIGP